MADEIPFASQSSFSTNRDPTPDRNSISSPLLAPQRDTGKRKQLPTVTPKRFTRFFTPRSSLRQDSKIGASRQALRDITASASNHKNLSRRRTPTKDRTYTLGNENGTFAEMPTNRKRKVPVSPDTTPDRSSPLKRIRNQSLGLPEHNDTDGGRLMSSDEEHLGIALLEQKKRRQRRLDFVEPIVCLRQRGPLGRALRQEMGYNYATSRKPNYDTGDWQNETANFFSRPEDSYVCENVEKPGEQTIPFCATSCNTNSLVAIGDEDGGIRLLESAKDDKPGFSKAYLTFIPHANAILDLAFSPDDLLLATASGDQTAKIIDMPTQRSIFTLNGHTSSVKQIRFQPGSSSVLASSSRDGSIQIWDLRCKGDEAPSQSFRVSLDGEHAPGRSFHNKKMTWAHPTDSIHEAHATRHHPDPKKTNSTTKTLSSFDAPSKTESPSRRGDVSITALSFLNPSRAHLLLTASEANASVKLWDLRKTHTHRRSTRATPLSSTRQPESHTTHRHFGLTSLALSGDAAHLYTLCRDNTVYTYSTSHLILGSAPELSSSTSFRPRRSGTAPEKEGLGPIYGFRHPNLHATTFYVKSSLRPAGNANSELLAVGSSDGCAILFPTDERYMARPRHQGVTTPAPTVPRLNDTIPIYTHGSALVRGHGREVTGLTWTRGGELISVGDDFRARCWREDAPGARELRTGGEGEGRRWGCGWAEVGDGWDDDDE